jgi:hypothetical protein
MPCYSASISGLHLPLCGGVWQKDVLLAFLKCNFLRPSQESCAARRSALITGRNN